MRSTLVTIGRRQCQAVLHFGRFGVFVGRTGAWMAGAALTRRNSHLLLPQLFEIGNRSLPVILITGIFVGLVLAVQAYGQLESMGLEEQLGVLVNLSVVKELGPVLAGVMLAGRVGGALVAELGTMNVTEQIDALRSMGSDPTRYLVVPRVMACILLTPILTFYCDCMGALGGYIIAVGYYGVAAEPYVHFVMNAVGTWDIFTGFVKSVCFGTLIALISCYKGFHCRPGAEGVGRACTEAFVANFIAILVIDFFLGFFMQSMYQAIWGFQPLL